MQNYHQRLRHSAEVQSKVSLIHLSFPSSEVFPVDLGQLLKPAGRSGESREQLLLFHTTQQQKEDIQEVTEGEP